MCADHVVGREGLPLGQATDRVARQLQLAMGGAANAEARELVAAVFGQPRFWPTLAADRQLTEEEVLALDAAAQRRAAGAPLAYAARSAAFRHLTLTVDERVLIPRPETERLIDLVLESPQGRVGVVAVDIGTGSGAIALALATEGRFRRVVATDVSVDALDIARLNAARLPLPAGVSLEFRDGDALAPLPDLQGQVDVLVSNPPYIAFAEAPELPALVRDWEPPQALTCSDDGLAVTRTIVTGAGHLLREGGLLALEVDSRRATRVAEMLHAAGGWREVRVLQDLTGRERYVLATWQGTDVTTTRE
jgi:release factor glutamine methyltransferase